MALDGSTSEKVPGTTILPQARVKRLIKEDKDIALINAEATFCITLATELFLEYFANEGYIRAQKDKRKTLFYKDFANAVSEVEQFEFLEDVVPQTMSLKSALEQRSGALGESSSKRQKVTHEENAAEPEHSPSE